MDIAYPTRSQFLDACETARRKYCAELDAGGVVHVDLQEGGYGGRVNITISATDRTAFGTDWESPEAAMRLPRSTKLQACRPYTLCTRKVCVISLPPRLDGTWSVGGRMPLRCQ